MGRELPAAMQSPELVRIRTPREVATTRVTLINLPTVTAPRSFSFFGAVPPLGLAYIAATLREAGHDVAVVDGTGEALDTTRTRVTSVGPLAITGMAIEQIVDAVDPATEVIGLSHTFLHQWPLLDELCVALRARHPRARIVVGGENATSFCEHILTHCPAIDVCVLGEGERPILALLQAWSHGRSPSEIPGLAYRGPDGEVVQTGLGERIEDLDALPDPAWDLFPVDAYLDRHHSGGVDRGRSMPLLTSRGCPYKCSFCSSPQMWTTRYLRRSPDRIIAEIRHYVERYRITNVDLNDLTAMLTKDWMIEFAKAMIASGLEVSIQLPSGTRAEAVDAETAQWLYRAGVRNFCYAPESGSTTTLERIHKKVKLPRLRASLAAAIDAGLTTHASIIIGFPHERSPELLDTYKLVVRLALDGLDTLAVMVFAPYPGSEEYARLCEQGVVVHDERYFYSSLLRSAGATRSVHPRLSARELAALQLAFLMSFYGVAYARRPARLLDIARRVVGERQESVMDQFLTTKLTQFTKWWPRPAATR